MKVWVICDLEGVATISSFDHQCQFDGRYYEQSKRLASSEELGAEVRRLASQVPELRVSEGDRGWVLSLPLGWTGGVIGQEGGTVFIMGLVPEPAALALLALCMAAMLRKRN